LTVKQPTDRQRAKWRDDRARLRLMAHLFPAPPKLVLTPAEKRAIKTQNQRERRDAVRLGKVDLNCPLVFK
jgi:hypothetical protein